MMTSSGSLKDMEAKRKAHRAPIAAPWYLFILSPFAFIYAVITTLRNWRFDMSDRSRQAHSQVSTEKLVAVDIEFPKVVSIGNLTAGGTGKTPVTALLARELTGLGHKVGIVSRGYGRALVSGDGADVLHVDQTNIESAQVFGDEPTLLAKLLSDLQIPVAVAADRGLGVKALSERFGVSVVLADDAHQHRQLHRELNFVLVDATEPFWHYQILPAGRARELPAQGLSRADIVLFTRTDQVPAEHLLKVRKMILSYTDPRRILFNADLVSAISGWRSLRLDLESLPSKHIKRVVVVAAIARPASFRLLIERFFDNLNIAPPEVVEMYFTDHHSFSDQDFRAIQTRADEFHAEAILITEKDAVKFGKWSDIPNRIPVYVSQLETRFSNSQSVEVLKRELSRRLV